jgi:cell division cycle 20-like protein 1 (cofactor of APC complex)
MMLQNSQSLNNLNSQVVNNLNNNNINNVTNTSITNQVENTSNANNINNYQNLMMDSLLLRSNSESFSIDKNNIKNMTMFNESHRERVLSFNSNNINNSNAPSKQHPKNFLNQIKNMAENKSLTEPFHMNNKSTSLSNRLREINLTPERILDAPSLIDDYYLNLIDWSSLNILAVSLGTSVYLWNGNTSETLQLMTNTENICSVNWINSGTCLAVGLQNGHIELWDTNKLQQIRNMDGHSDRVCSLSWNNFLLSSGSKDTKIINHDVRVRNHSVHNLIGHTQEVCALKWSPDGSLLASGGNDNLMCIWDVNSGSTSSNINNNIIRSRSSSAAGTGAGANFNSNNLLNSNNFLNNNGPFNESALNMLNNNNTGLGNNLNSNFTNNILMGRSTNSIWNIIEENDQPNNNQNYNNNHTNNNTFNSNVTQISPKFVFNQHEAAVKALAWCPWQKGLLASGAGSKDKTIKFWNIDTGSLINSVDSGSQVCALLWNKHEKELISSHGYSKHQISLWKYPSMYKVTELNGHMSRVLYLAMSPDGCSIVSGAGDETLRFWKIHDNKKSSNESVDFKMMNGFQLR